MMMLLLLMMMMMHIFVCHNDVTLEAMADRVML